MSTSCRIRRSALAAARNSITPPNCSPRSMFQSTTRMELGGQSVRLHGAKSPVSIACLEVTSIVPLDLEPHLALPPLDEDTRDCLRGTQVFSLGGTQRVCCWRCRGRSERAIRVKGYEPDHVRAYRRQDKGDLGYVK